MQSAAIEVDSAGVKAYGDAAMPEAVEVMHEYGLDLSNHQPKTLDDKLVDWANLVLVMERRHKQVILSRFRESEKKIYVLSEYIGEKDHVPIPDPFEYGIEVYGECAALLHSKLEKLLEKLKS